jgi:hypothetical protein
MVGLEAIFAVPATASSHRKKKQKTKSESFPMNPAV